MQNLRFVLCLASLLTMSAGCATFSRSHSHNGGDSASMSDDEGADDTGDGEDEDESDTAGTEQKEETPEELGDVQVSSTRNAEEIAADEQARKSFPLVYNEFVEQWISYFRGRGFTTFQKWLGRSTRYIPMMKQILREEGLPEDLIYLSMIESGFNPKAASRAKAVGPWQFIKATGQRYGLKVTYWIDERRDYYKATYAAARYLRELQQIFGSWYLAAASYNAGEGKVLLAVRRDRSRNFWELARRKKNFRSETRNYVPKIIAAALVSKNPEKYGFSGIGYEQPLDWETVHVPSGVDLRSVASIINEDTEKLQILNSELRRGITPPDSDGYDIRVPPDKKAVVLANMEQIKSHRVGNFISYRIRRGDTLSGIARRFGTDIQSLLDLNQLRSRRTRLRAGRHLQVPVLVRGEFRTGNSHSSKVAGRGSSASRKIASYDDDSPRSKSYRVRRGDSLWTISRKFDVTVKELQSANGLRSASSIRPGQRLRIP